MKRMVLGLAAFAVLAMGTAIVVPQTATQAEAGMSKDQVKAIFMKVAKQVAAQHSEVEPPYDLKATRLYERSRYYKQSIYVLGEYLPSGKRSTDIIKLRMYKKRYRGYVFWSIWLDPKRPPITGATKI